VSDYDETKRDAIKQVLASAAGVAPTAVEITIEPASVKVGAIITSPAVSAATATATLATGILANSSALESALVSGGVSGVVVTAITETPVVAASPPPPPFAPPPTGGSGLGPALYGIIAGSVVGVLVIGLVLYKFVIQRKSTSKVPAQTI